MKNHHPTIETLTEYASGGLKMSHALCISTHIEYCPECQAQVRKLEQVGAQIFNMQEQTLSMSESTEQLKHTVFDKIFNDTNKVEPIAVETHVMKPSASAKASNVPKSLGQFVDTDFEQLEWSRISPSIKIATLCNDSDGSQIALSCVKPGGKMPHHTHTGQELTVVLEGSFSDEDGIYHKGDFLLRNAKDKHKPVVTKDAECICLMVLDSPIEFTGFFAKMLNPLLRRNHYHQQ